MVTLKHKLDDGEIAPQHFHSGIMKKLPRLLLVERFLVLVLPRTFSTEQNFENFTRLTEREITA